MNDLKPSRREFTLRSLVAVLGGVSVSVSTSACGGGGSPGSSPTGGSSVPSDGSVVGSVSANHGHVATVTAVQLGAGGAVVLDIRGTADHPHSVELDADEVVAIAGGARVVSRSSNNDGHFHQVTFN